MIGFFKTYLLKPACYIGIVILALYVLNKFTYFNISFGSNNNYRSFEVVGAGKVTATPNIATTTFTISEKSATTQEAAKNAANAKQNNALAQLQQIGIRKSDITSTISVGPNYEDQTAQPQIYPKPPQTQNGYMATINTTVKANNVDLINKAIDKLTALGINVGGVSYSFASQTVYMEQAQTKAIENAKEQAANIAKAAGFRVGKIISVRNADEQNGPRSLEAGAMLKSNADTSTNLQPGSNEITARMGVTFEIKN